MAKAKNVTVKLEDDQKAGEQDSGDGAEAANTVDLTGTSPVEMQEARGESSRR